MSETFFTTKADDEQLVTQRREFLKIGMAGAAAMMIPFLSTKSAAARNNSSAWKVSFRNTHTEESFSGVYRVGDKYLPEAFERMNYVLRDFRTQEVFPMDPHVIDIMSLVQRKMDADMPFDVLSGYRSPKTNAMLGRKSRAVASNSFHMYGQAVDLRIPDYSARKIRNIAKSLNAGGVGYYPRSNFVHVDTGEPRTWVS